MTTLWGPTLDCRQPRELALFYQRIVGGEITCDDGNFVQLRLDATSLGFQRDPQYRPPTWPSNEIPQQCHLDFSAADLDSAEAGAIAAGATKSEHQPGPTIFRVLIDPAGHPFCFTIWGTPAGPDHQPQGETP